MKREHSKKPVKLTNLRKEMRIFIQKNIPSDWKSCRDGVKSCFIMTLMIDKKTGLKGTRSAKGMNEWEKYKKEVKKK